MTDGCNRFLAGKEIRDLGLEHFRFKVRFHARGMASRQQRGPIITGINIPIWDWMLKCPTPLHRVVRDAAVGVGDEHRREYAEALSRKHSRIGPTHFSV